MSDTIGKEQEIMLKGQIYPAIKSCVSWNGRKEINSLQTSCPASLGYIYSWVSACYPGLICYHITKFYVGHVICFDI